MAYRASPETVNKRIEALRTSSKFEEAARKSGDRLVTLKTWARRNEALVKSRIPGYNREDYLQLTPSQREARKPSLAKASEAARQARRGGTARSRGAVKVKPPEPQEEGPRINLEEVLMRAVQEARLLARAWDRNAELKDEVNRLRARVRELEMESEELKADDRYHTLMVRNQMAEEDNARLRNELAARRAQLKRAGLPY